MNEDIVGLLVENGFVHIVYTVEHVLSFQLNMQHKLVNFLHCPFETNFSFRSRAICRQIAERIYNHGLPFYLSPEQSEVETLVNLKEFAATTNYQYICYLHPKGSSRPSKCQDDWRELMLYYLIDRSTESIKILDENPTIQAVGCNKSEAPSPHFSGNMWLARSSFINQLPSPDSIKSNWGSSWGGRCRAEMFIGMHGSDILYSLHQSNVNHYHDRYPQSNYNIKDFIG